VLKDLAERLEKHKRAGHTPGAPTICHACWRQGGISSLVSPSRSNWTKRVRGDLDRIARRRSIREASEIGIGARHRSTRGTAEPREQGGAPIRVLTLPRRVCKCNYIFRPQFSKVMPGPPRAAFRKQPPTAVLAMGGFSAPADFCGSNLAQKRFPTSPNTIPGPRRTLLSRSWTDAFIGFPKACEPFAQWEFGCDRHARPCGHNSARDAASAGSALGFETTARQSRDGRPARARAELRKWS